MQLIKHVHIFAPQDLEIQNIPISEGHTAHIAPHIETTPYMKITDGSGEQLTPGLIGRHIHVSGGGGGDGFATGTSEIQLSTLIQAGVTTVVGLLGTDGMTRSAEDLIAKAKTLRSEGISTYAMTGSYAYPSTTVTGSVKEDILFMDEIPGVKFTLGDHRSLHTSFEEFLKLASEVRTVGMLSGKPGCITLHVGGEADDLAYVMKAMRSTGLPCTMFHPTHVARNEQLFQKALQFSYMGSTIDITCEEHEGCTSWIKQTDPKDYGGITVSPDGQESWSDYDEYGNLTAVDVSDISVLLQGVQKMMQDQDLSVTECISFSTANPARILGLYPAKGYISIGNNANLLLFNDDWQLSDIMANRRWFMKNQKLLKKGTFEQAGCYHCQKTN